MTTKWPCPNIAAITTVRHSQRQQCDECIKSGDSWVHLRTCQTCGAALCCDNSPNRHATRHTQEGVYPVVASAEPGGVGSTAIRMMPVLGTESEGKAPLTLCKGSHMSELLAGLRARVHASAWELNRCLAWVQLKSCTPDQASEKGNCNGEFSRSLTGVVR